MNTLSFVLGIISAISFGSLIGMAINERLHRRTQEELERIKKSAEEENWRCKVNADIRVIKEKLGLPVRDTE